MSDKELDELFHNSLFEGNEHPFNPKAWENMNSMLNDLDDAHLDQVFESKLGEGQNFAFNPSAWNKMESILENEGTSEIDDLFKSKLFPNQEFAFNPAAWTNMESILDQRDARIWRRTFIGAASIVLILLSSVGIIRYGSSNIQENLISEKSLDTQEKTNVKSENIKFNKKEQAELIENKSLSSKVNQISPSEPTVNSHENLNPTLQSASVKPLLDRGNNIQSREITPIIFIQKARPSIPLHSKNPAKINKNPTLLLALSGISDHDKKEESLDLATLDNLQVAQLSKSEVKKHFENKPFPHEVLNKRPSIEFMTAPYISETANSSPKSILGKKQKVKKMKYDLMEFESYISLLAGASFSQTTTLSEGAIFSKSYQMGGLNLAYHLKNKVSINSGLIYETKNGQNLEKQFTTTYYGFSKVTETTTILPLSMHYISLPLKVEYHVGYRHSLMIGTRLSYLLNTYSQVTFQKESNNEIIEENQSKKWGYTEGLNPIDAGFSMAYKFKYSSKFNLILSAYQGLSDMTKGGSYETSRIDRNINYRFALEYKLFKLKN